MAEESPPTIKDRFGFLYALANQYHLGLVDFSFKQCTLFAVVTGWLISSEPARAFLANHLGVRVVLTVFVLLWTCLHAFGAYKYYLRSKLAYDKLFALEYMSDCISHSAIRIRPYLPASLAIFHGAFTVLVVFLIWSLP